MSTIILGKKTNHHFSLQIDHLLGEGTFARFIKQMIWKRIQIIGNVMGNCSMKMTSHIEISKVIITWSIVTNQIKSILINICWL